MEDTDRSAEALFEALLISREFREATRPSYYYRGKMHNDWWYATKDRDDIVYYNTESKLHRIYGPSYISLNYDIEAWHKDGLLHRTDGGPAYRHKECRYWFQEGKLHRTDGPAVEAPGHPKEYWINGQKWPVKFYKKEIARRMHKGLL